MMDDREREAERAILEIVKRSIHETGQVELTGLRKWLYRFRLLRHINKQVAPKPLTLILLASVYKILLKFEVLRCNYLSNGDLRRSKIEMLEFASKTGRITNENQRQWFLDQKTAYKMSDRDAWFLAWVGILWFRKNEIQFSKWIWVGGLVMMVPALFLVACAVASCFCCVLNPIEKAKIVFCYLFAGFVMFIFYKTRSFDAYRVGLKYFQPAV